MVEVSRSAYLHSIGNRRSGVAPGQMISPRGRVRIAFVLVLASAWLPFAPVLFARWAADDFILVEGFLREFPTWRTFLAASFLDNFGGGGGLYRPIGFLSIYTDLRVFGPNPEALHLSSLAWHGLASALVVALGLVVSRGNREGVVPLVCVGVFFAAFPRRVEPVAWVSCRPDLVAAVLGTAAVWMWLRCDGARWRLGSTILFAMSLLAKETAVFLPAVLPLASSGRRGIQRVLRIWPFLVAMGIVAIMRRTANGEWLGGGANAPSFSASALVNAAKLVTYSVVPPLQHLNRALLDVRAYWLSLCVLVAVLIVIVWACWSCRHDRRVRFGTAWVIASIIPVLGIAPSLTSSMNDRVLYLPGVGVALALLGILHTRSRRVTVAAGAALLVSACGSFALSSNWLLAGRETARVVATLGEAVRATPAGCKVRVAGVPDNYRGAYMLRNGTEAALRLGGLPLTDAARVEVLSHFWLTRIDDLPIEVKVMGRKRFEILGVGGRPEVIVAFGDALRVGRVEAAPGWDRYARHPRVAVELQEAAALLAPVSDASDLRFLQTCD